MRQIHEYWSAWMPCRLDHVVRHRTRILLRLTHLAISSFAESRLGCKECAIVEPEHSPAARAASPRPCSGASWSHGAGSCCQLIHPCKSCWMLDECKLSSFAHSSHSFTNNNAWCRLNLSPSRLTRFAAPLWPHHIDAERNVLQQLHPAIPRRSS